MAPVKPLHDRLIVEPIKAPKSDILFVPDNPAERGMCGRVLAVGDGVLSEIAPGDVVHYQPHAFFEFEHDGKKLMNVPEMSVLFVEE